MDQCVYSEDGRRCRRSGTGIPALCNPHRIVFAEQARAPQHRPVERIVDLFDTFMSGKKITTDHIMGVAQDVAWAMGGSVAAGYHPDVTEDGRTQHAGRRSAAQGWGGMTPDEIIGDIRQRFRDRPPPPPEPQQGPTEEDLRRARVTLGFAASEPVTEDQVKDRRRRLARKHHPDLGGSTEKMKAVNEAADVLLASLT